MDKSLEVVNTGSLAEILMMEPALEALYYEADADEIIVHGIEPEAKVRPVLERHPLTLLYKELPKDQWEITLIARRAIQGTVLKSGRSMSGAHYVQKYAELLNVTLLRDTPSLGNYRHTLTKPKTVTRPVMVTEYIPAQSWWPFTLSLQPDAPTEDQISDLEQATLFVGLELKEGPSASYQLAHALGVRHLVVLASHPELTRNWVYPGTHVIPLHSNTAIEELLGKLIREEHYPAALNKGNAMEWIKNEALRYCHGRGLDVGSNRVEWALPGATPSDHDSRKFDQGPFDYIFSSHCLEHIREWQAELQIWYDALRPGGTVFLYVPHPAMEMWHPEGDWVKGGWHVHSPEPVEIVKFMMEQTGFEVERYTAYPDYAWGFYVVARKPWY